MSKCRGSFDPQKILGELEKESEDSFVIEEAFCMNQCKRGPNIRLIRNGHVLTFDEDGIMNETEKRRKTFQSVGNEEHLERIWGLGQGLVDGTIKAIENEPIEKLSDIIPSS